MGEENKHFFFDINKFANGLTDQLVVARKLFSHIGEVAKRHHRTGRSAEQDLNYYVKETIVKFVKEKRDKSKKDRDQPVQIDGKGMMVFKNEQVLEAMLNVLGKEIQTNIEMTFPNAKTVGETDYWRLSDVTVEVKKDFSVKVSPVTRSTSAAIASLTETAEPPCSIAGSNETSCFDPDFGGLGIADEKIEEELNSRPLEGKTKTTSTCSTLADYKSLFGEDSDEESDPTPSAEELFPSAKSEIEFEKLKASTKKRKREKSPQQKKRRTKKKKRHEKDDGGDERVIDGDKEELFGKLVKEHEKETDVRDTARLISEHVTKICENMSIVSDVTSRCVQSTHMLAMWKQWHGQDGVPCTNGCLRHCPPNVGLKRPMGRPPKGFEKMRASSSSSSSGNK